MISKTGFRAALPVLLLFAACSRPARVNTAVAPQDSGSEAPALATTPAQAPVTAPVAPDQLEAAFDATWKALSRTPEDAAARDAFARAWLDWEFHLLGEERQAPAEDAPPLRLDGCAAEASARDCLLTRIGRRFDSSWYRVETRGDAVLLLFFHARGRYDDTETGNELVVFRGTLQTKQGAPPQLTLLSRNEVKVSDLLGATLGGSATPADPKDPATRWGIRFQPLGPQEFALVDALPDEWLALRRDGGRHWRYKESPAHGARLFIVKEPGLRMAWLSFQHRDGQLKPIPRVSKEESTYQLGDYSLRWEARSPAPGLLADGSPHTPDEPYVPVRAAEKYPFFTPPGPTPKELREQEAKAGTYKTEEGRPVPELAGRLLARLCGDRGYVAHLKAGLYEVRCSCGTSCGASTYVDVDSGRTSSMYSLPLAVDPEGMRVALSTHGQMPIRIVGLFDEKEWLRLRRPTEETSDLSGVVEASFSGNRFYLRYLERRGGFGEEEEVALPDRPVEAPRAHE